MSICSWKSIWCPPRRYLHYSLSSACTLSTPFTHPCGISINAHTCAHTYARMIWFLILVHSAFFSSSLLALSTLFAPLSSRSPLPFSLVELIKLIAVSSHLCRLTRAFVKISPKERCPQTHTRRAKCLPEHQYNYTRRSLLLYAIATVHSPPCSLVAYVS